MKRKTFFNSILVLLLIFTFLLLNRGAFFFRSYLNGSSVGNSMDLLLPSFFKNPFAISFNTTDLVASLGLFAAFLMLVANKKRHMRPGEEYGSARWGTDKEMAPLIDPVFERNLILTQKRRLRVIDGKDWKNSRNKNVVVCGGSGSGKTRFFVKPNLLQGINSVIVTDPKGTLPAETGAALLHLGYNVKILNIKSAEGMRSSMHYNPFVYIKNEVDIISFCKNLILNTKGEDTHGGDDFWVKAEELLYYALVGYMLREAPPEEQNIGTFLTLLSLCDAKEEDEDYMSTLDLMFNDVEDRECFAVKQYAKFKFAAGKTAKSILVSCGARLAPFDVKEVRELMSYDDLDMETYGDIGSKTALFLLISDNDMTFNFLASMVCTQLFQRLISTADEKYDGFLPIHVQCLLDEFANIGKIPDFDKIISVIRSRNISACPIIQSRSQLEGLYDKKTEAIIDCCDSFLFLGGKGQKTLEEVVKIIGKETIETSSDGKSRGSQKSDSTNFQKTGRELITADELASMPKEKCVVHITGLRPFLDDKFILEKHPQYKLLKERLDVNKYVACPFPNDGEEFIYFES